MTKSRSRERVEYRVLFPRSRAQSLRLALKNKYFLLISDVRRELAFSMIAVGVGERGCGRPNKAAQLASGLRCCGPRPWELKAYEESAQPANVGCVS